MGENVKTGCGTCRFAEWQLGPKGKRRPNVSGRCNYLIPLPPVPGCVKLTVGVTAIWPDMYDDCNVWEPKK
jgi:hypothetical protein